MRLRGRIAKTTVVAMGFVMLGESIALAAGLNVAVQKLTVFQGATSVAATTCTLTASVDTYVDQSSPGSSFGGATQLLVRSRNQNNARSLVKFDLTACPNFSNALVNSASLTLHLESAPSATRDYGAHRVTSTWSGTTTWDTPLSFNATATSTIATVASGNPVTWTVAADVQAFVNGTANEGWLIKDTVENATLEGRQAAIGYLGVFSSSDQGTYPKPTLVITYYP